MEDIQLIQGDCLQRMECIPDKSIDMILCDLPYGVTKNKWDIIIDFERLWCQYERIIKSNAPIILFGQGMFTAKLMCSNADMWRYNLVWDKVLKSGFLNANRQPLRSHEDICVFYKKQPIYNPKFTIGIPLHSRGKNYMSKEKVNNNYGEYLTIKSSREKCTDKYPTSLLRFQKTHPSKSLHPTQKPVCLLQYLIETYTDENMTVLDNCMGSGSTGVACVNINRKFIGIELDNKYFNIAKSRINEAINIKKSSLFLTQ